MFLIQTYWDAAAAAFCFLSVQSDAFQQFLYVELMKLFEHEN